MTTMTTITAKNTPTATEKKRKKLKFNTAVPYLYVAPMVILLIVFSGYPFIEGIVKSFYMDDGFTVSEFVGFRNYIEILTKDRLFWISMRNLVYLFIGMNICVCTPLIAAKLTYSILSERAKFLIRFAFTIGTVVPSVITLMIWKFIYYPGIGMVARICSVFGWTDPNLLGNPKTAIIAIIIMGFPWVSGLSYLMYFAGLQGIDTSVIEAAKIDGASNWQTFFHVELPELRPIFMSLYTLAFIGQFNDYERFLILTGGGPDNSTLTPALYMYQKAFGSPGAAAYGYACAIAVILLIINLTLTKLLIKHSDED